MKIDKSTGECNVNYVRFDSKGVSKTVRCISARPETLKNSKTVCCECNKFILFTSLITKDILCYRHKHDALMTGKAN